MKQDRVGVPAAYKPPSLSEASSSSSSWFMRAPFRTHMTTGSYLSALSFELGIIKRLPHLKGTSSAIFSRHCMGSLTVSFAYIFLDGWMEDVRSIPGWQQ